MLDNVVIMSDNICGLLPLWQQLAKEEFERLQNADAGKPTGVRLDEDSPSGFQDSVGLIAWGSVGMRRMCSFATTVEGAPVGCSLPMGPVATQSGLTGSQAQ